MKCQDFHEIVDSYLCDELQTETNHEVLRHLEACANCRGVIESRRILRAKIKSAVKNSSQFQIRDIFYSSLCAQLKQSVVIEESPKFTFRTRNTFWMAFAASVIFVVGLSFWVFQAQPGGQISVPEIALQDMEKPQKAVLSNFAVGDHQNCAVKYNLAEEPVDIDIKSAQYAYLRQAVLTPLEKAREKYKFLESHTCKFAGQNFTHIVFRHQNKLVSVLITDLPDNQPLKNEEITKNYFEGYQVAHFDVKNQAVFVISDLSEDENFATAKILESPMKRQFSVNEEAKLAVFTIVK